MPNEETAVEETVEETVEAPSEESTEEVVEETATEETPTEETTEEEPVADLYELPDGRKVDGQTLQKEWKENFLPDYTRKSQTLADIEREKNINSEVPEWEKEGYQPKDWSEVVKISTNNALNIIKDGQAEDLAQKEARQTQIDNDLSEIKAQNPKLDANALFLHANKYGFQDLKSAFTNMKDMSKVIEKTQQNTIKNLKNRELDPVSTKAGEVAPSGSIDMNDVRDVSPQELLRTLKK